MLTRLGTLLLCCFFASDLAAKKPVIVALTHIPKVLDHTSPNAPYNRFIERIRTDLSVDVDFQYMTSERGTGLLATGKVDCIFPIIPGDYLRKDKTLFSEPINGIALYVFSVAQEFKSLAELNHQMVVYLRGYLFANYINQFPDITFFPVSNQLNALEMLKNKRASAYIDYYPDVRFSLPPRDFSKLKYDLKSPLLTDSDRFECKAFGHSLTFLKHVNKVVTELHKTDEMKQVLGAYYAPYKPD